MTGRTSQGRTAPTRKPKRRICALNEHLCPKRKRKRLTDMQAVGSFKQRSVQVCNMIMVVCSVRVYAHICRHRFMHTFCQTCSTACTSDTFPEFGFRTARMRRHCTGASYAHLVVPEDLQLLREHTHCIGRHQRNAGNRVARQRQRCTQSRCQQGSVAARAAAQQAKQRRGGCTGCGNGGTSPHHRHACCQLAACGCRLGEAAGHVSSEFSVLWCILNIPIPVFSQLSQLCRPFSLFASGIHKDFTRLYESEGQITAG